VGSRSDSGGGQAARAATHGGARRRAAARSPENRVNAISATALAPVCPGRERGRQGTCLWARDGRAGPGKWHAMAGWPGGAPPREGEREGKEGLTMVLTTSRSFYNGWASKESGKAVVSGGPCSSGCSGAARVLRGESGGCDSMGRPRGLGVLAQARGERLDLGLSPSLARRGRGRPQQVGPAYRRQREKEAARAGRGGGWAGWAEPRGRKVREKREGKRERRRELGWAK
jgi:hypothetical protein